MAATLATRSSSPGIQPVQLLRWQQLRRGLRCCMSTSTRHPGAAASPPPQIHGGVDKGAGAAPRHGCGSLAAGEGGLAGWLRQRLDLWGPSSKLGLQARGGRFLRLARFPIWGAPHTWVAICSVPRTKRRHLNPATHSPRPAPGLNSCHDLRPACP